jgi:hypothetical protein
MECHKNELDGAELGSRLRRQGSWLAALQVGVVRGVVCGEIPRSAAQGLSGFSPERNSLLLSSHNSRQNKFIVGIAVKRLNHDLCRVL